MYKTIIADALLIGILYFFVPASFISGSVMVVIISTFVVIAQRTRQHRK